MNEMQSLHHAGSWRKRRFGRILPGIVAALLLTVGIFFALWGCSDPRTPPAPTRDPGYTESITLWVNEVSAGQRISKSFYVDGELAAINRVGVDSPARLTIAAYIHPDCQMLRREQIVAESIPYLTDSVIIPYLQQIATVKNGLSAAQRMVVDSLEAVFRSFVRVAQLSMDSLHPREYFVKPGFDSVRCDSPLFGSSVYHLPDAPDTTGRTATFQAISARLAELENGLGQVLLDTMRLGLERDLLEKILDDRYTLAIWLDSDTTTRYPEALYRDASRMLVGQRLFAAATDSATGRKGRGFRLDLEAFQCADPVNYMLPLTVNWTVCFPGSTAPCLKPDTTHTIHARVTGPDARITATLVLVYKEERP